MFVETGVYVFINDFFRVMALGPSLSMRVSFVVGFQKTVSRYVSVYLGCGQVFHLKDKVDYVEASPDIKKCFWAGKKVFYLKKYDGELIFQK